MDRIRQFIGSLDSSLELIHRLETVMLEEMRAIESHEPDRLQEIVTEKLALVNQLETETAQQKLWIELQDHAFTPEGIADFIAAFDQNDQLAERWSQIRESVRRCNQLNKANARLIERDRKRIALSLRIIRGEDGAGATYNLQGRPEADHQHRRTISQA